MNSQAPLNLSLPPETPREKRVREETTTTLRLVRLLGEILVCPTRMRIAGLMTELEDYQEDWIRRRSGEPK